MSSYDFSVTTRGKEPILIAQRNSGSRIRVEEMSEGTLDQLYLALRLTALYVRRATGIDLPDLRVDFRTS